MKKVSYVVGVRLDASPIVVEHHLEVTKVKRGQTPVALSKGSAQKKNQRFSSKRMKSNKDEQSTFLPES